MNMFELLIIASAILTAAMFMSKQSMLGFPSAILWAIVGGYAYTQSVSSWDIYQIFALGCLIGMTPFSIYSAYGLNKKADKTVYEMEEDRKKGINQNKYMDETESEYEGIFGDEERKQERKQKILNMRKRAQSRRTKNAIGRILRGQ